MTANANDYEAAKARNNGAAKASDNLNANPSDEDIIPLHDDGDEFNATFVNPSKPNSKLNEDAKKNEKKDFESQDPPQNSTGKGKTMYS